MKNITLSADERLIEAARACASAKHTTLSAQFRRWLEDYTVRQQRVEAALATLDKLQRTLDTGGRKFTREEMNGH